MVELLENIFKNLLIIYCRIFGHDWYGTCCVRCGEHSEDGSTHRGLSK